MFAGFAAEAATIYECKVADKKVPAGATIAVLVLMDNGDAGALDVWSANPKNGGSDDNWADVKIRRNDATNLDASWTTDRLRSNISTYHQLDFILQIKKADMSFYLSMSSSEVREQNFRGTCIKSKAKG